jgi:hypothetical protein
MAVQTPRRNKASRAYLSVIVIQGSFQTPLIFEDYILTSYCEVLSFFFPPLIMLKYLEGNYLINPWRGAPRIKFSIAA